MTSSMAMAMTKKSKGEEGSQSTASSSPRRRRRARRNNAFAAVAALAFALAAAAVISTTTTTTTTVSHHHHQPSALFVVLGVEGFETTVVPSSLRLMKRNSRNNHNHAAATRRKSSIHHDDDAATAAATAAFAVPSRRPSSSLTLLFSPLSSQSSSSSSSIRRKRSGGTATTTTTTTRLRSSSSSSSSNQEAEECSIDDEEDECMVRSGYKSLSSSQSQTAAGISKVYVAEIECLRQNFDSYESLDSIGKNMIKYNRRWGNPARRVDDAQETKKQYKKNPVVTVNTHVANLEYNRLVDENDIVLVDTIRSSGSSADSNGVNNSGGMSRAFPLAGPRRHLHFDPTQVNAAVVTCGGLCPGLNNVIREIVHTLTYQYGVSDTNIYGIVGGFRGFHQNIDEGEQAEEGKKLFEPLKLTNHLVKDIHHDGGTLLRSARGGFDVDEIIDFLSTNKINQLYVIGGDGTHRAAYKIHQECSTRRLNIAVAGIPKTIDNDIDYIDRSFGFQSSVEAAQLAIRTAKVEASSTVPNAVSVVKLMGRSAGFLASFAALGSGDVDAVLVPEVPIVLDGPSGILPFIRKRVKEQDHAVVVVAEGAGEELLGESSIMDKGGNKALPPIGEYMKEQIIQHFDEHGEEATVRYIDPSYTVRSVPANAADSLYCMQLAQNAVHGAMAGLTGFASGMMNNQPVYVPIPKLVSTSPRSMDPTGPTWEQILAMTGQPNTVEIVQEDECEEDEGVGEEDDADVIEEAPFPEPTLF